MSDIGRILGKRLVIDITGIKFYWSDLLIVLLFLAFVFAGFSKSRIGRAVLEAPACGEKITCVADATSHMRGAAPSRALTL